MDVRKPPIHYLNMFALLAPDLRSTCCEIWTGAPRPYLIMNVPARDEEGDRSKHLSASTHAQHALHDRVAPACLLHE
jgi:hypothetical protein